MLKLSFINGTRKVKVLLLPETIQDRMDRADEGLSLETSIFFIVSGRERINLYFLRTFECNTYNGNV